MNRSVLTRLLSGFTVAVVLTVSATTVPPASAAMSASTERAAIERLYVAAFDRPADGGGLDYWHATLRRGVDLNEIADYFVQSAEFRATYGNVNSTGLITLIYRNVLGRQPDGPGLAYWVGLLDQGHSPGTILNGFAQSQEFITSFVPTAPAHVLLIGDSIFHGIRLLDIPVGPAQLTFMTEEGRQADTLPGLINEASVSGLLATADVVVIHLGTNGWLPDYVGMFNDQLAALYPKPVLLVNTKVARSWEAASNDALASIAAQIPNVELVDWNGAVARHPEWMRPDGIHPNSEGLEALAALIEAAMSGIY